MQRDTDRYKLFTRRALLLGGAQVVLLGGLLVRLYQLQVVDAPKYAVLADDNRINLRLLPPTRGLIFDRAGVPLAVNRQNYRVLLISEKTGSTEATLDRLDVILSLGEGERRRVMRELQRNRSFVPVMVRENLSWDEVAQIEFNAPDLPGIAIDVGQLRDYPIAESLSHILGYVSAVTEKDLRDDPDPVLSLPGFRTGKKGIENAFEKQLRGRAGNLQVEVNSVGRTIRELARTDGQAGANLVLTIDSELQKFVYNRIKDQSAAAVVMDIHNGDVLSLVSTPGYDPNAFARGLTNAEWQDLLNNPRTPLNNKAIGGQYPPGSTFKMMTALAGLESGTITPSTVLPCAGVVELGDTKFHCWLRGGHGSVNLNLGLAQSCDCYFYEVAKRAGVDKIAEVALRFGLGKELGIEIPGEKPGLVPTRQWKQASLGQNWTQGETLVFGIGQGYMQATPLQLAVMAARLGNGGFAVVPRLLRDPNAPASQSPITARAAAMFPKLKLNGDSLKHVVAGMDAVTNSQRGTAYGARIVDPEMAMAGKTGTAQVKRITQADRDAGPKKIADIPWHLRHHALFVAFAPVGNPRYACAVVVEHGVGGASTAAPVARDILIECQKRDPSATPPKGQFASLSPNLAPQQAQIQQSITPGSR
ncbi:MAG: penicillin-binding protein 2 [Rhodospirillales bacterium]